MKISRGTLARQSREKRLAQRRKQDLSDLATNTRKRRKLARRWIAEEPLYAYGKLSELIPGYDRETFERDCKPTKGRRGKKKPMTARMEMHRQLVAKLDISNPANKLVTKLMLNWENIRKPFTIEFPKYNMVYTFPKGWPLDKIQRAAKEMQQQSRVSLDAIDKYWSGIRSNGS
jgi:hypothetical protein